MDDQRFDQLARTVAGGRSRRALLKALAGVAAGGLLGVGGGAAGAAPRCKRLDQRCHTSEDCCPGPTRNGDVTCAGTKVKTCQPCPGNAPTACNGGCVDTAGDNANCGACGRVCGGGTSCVGGVCRCPAGQSLCADGACRACCSDAQCGGGRLCCGGACVASDDANCGACGNACAAPTVCVGGACVNVQATCPAGADFCRDEAATCNGGACACLARRGGGTVCSSGGGLCAECAADAECAALTGPGSFCVDLSGPNCNCPTPPHTACVGPCPF